MYHLIPCEIPMKSPHKSLPMTPGHRHVAPKALNGNGPGFPGLVLQALTQDLLDTPIQRNHGFLVGNFHIPLGPCNF